jgi:hypothetical protein
MKDGVRYPAEAVALLIGRSTTITVPQTEKAPVPARA